MTAPSPPTPRRLRYRWLAAGVVALLLGAGHVWFWYLPRPRALALDAGSPVGSLFVSSAGSRLWLPYPHQSPLAARVLGLVETAAGSGALPPFGPFRLPPARQLAVARSPRATAIAVEVYPLWAVIGRLAGTLSRNNWLRSGRFEHRGERVEVAWRGRTWQVVLGEPAERGAGAATSSPSDPKPLLAAVALDRSWLGDSWGLGDPTRLGGVELGAIWGLVDLRPGEARLTPWAAASGVLASTELADAVASAREHEESRWAQLEASIDPCAAGGELAGAALCWREAGEPPTGEPATAESVERGLVLLAPSTPGEPGVWRLPSAAVLVRVDGLVRPGTRPALPAEAVVRRLDAVLLTERHAGWEITAIDEPALEAARRLAARWSPVSPPDSSAAGTGGSTRAAWIAPQRLGEVAREMADAVGGMPFADAGDAERWRLAADVLAGLESVDGVVVLARSGGILVRWDAPGA